MVPKCLRRDLLLERIVLVGEQEGRRAAVSRREFFKRGLVGIVAALALFVAGCGGEGGEEEENGGGY